MAVTRINNNQISDASAGNAYLGINAAVKLQNYSVTATKIANNLTYGSDLTITGNLTIQGNTTTVDTTYTTIEDPVILLASNQTGAPAVDIGFIGERGTSQNIAFVWDESASEFVTVFTNDAETNTTVTIASYASFHTKDANIGGNIVVNGTTSLVGSVIGNVSLAGNITMGNVLTNGQVSAAGNVTGGNINTGGLISATGNITSAANVAGGNLLATTIVSAASHIGTTASLSGNITGGNLLTDGLISSTGNITSAANIAGGNLIATSNVATTGIVASGTITGGNLLTSGQITATGNITGAANIAGGNLLATTTVSAASHIGTTASLSGNITGGNILTGGLISATSTITSAANITGANLVATSNVFAVGGYFTGNVTVLGNLNATIGIVYANSGVFYGATPTGNGAIYAGITGYTPLGSNVVAQFAGNANSYSQINFQNISNLTSASTDFIATADNGTDTSYYLDMGINSSTFNDQVNYPGFGPNDSYVHNHGGNLILNPETSGKVIKFMVGGTGNADVVANVTSTGITSGGTFSAAGNITSAANVAGGNLLATTIVSAASHIGSIASLSGNVTGGNLLTGGLISATGNITSAANVAGGNLLATTAVVTPTVIGTTVTVSSTGGLITLAPSSNVSVSNKYINSLADPVQNQDAATKAYVDNMASTQLAYHTAVTAATIGTLETATGGTITYTQPNGAGNGVGATLTVAGGSFTAIDTANIQTVGTRVLVKNQANTALNGVYTWANTSALVRATDADTYGPNSSTDLSVNDYFFVQSGNVNAGSAWVVDGPSGTITFGTSNITFAQFSSSQTYSANTSAGISFTGTVISAKVDNDTTAFDGGGNIIVKASANLVTPNIGAATGTSLSVTGNLTGAGANVSGNVSGGNLLTGGLISATANITGGNILTGGQVSSTGNITSSANISGGNLLTGGQVSSTGNITSAANVAGGNLIATTIVSAPSHIGTIVSVTANITGGNLLTGGQVSSTGNITSAANVAGGNVISSANVVAVGASISGNITGGNVLTSGIVSATGDITSAANVAGGNVIATTLVQGTTLSATGNVIGGNITTGGQVSATGNITSAANVAGGNLIATAIVSGASVLGTIVSASANITGGNILTGGLISATGDITSAANVAGGNVISSANVVAVGVVASGNVSGGNLLTGGLISATGNISSSANISGANVLGTNVSASGNITGANINTGGTNGLTLNASTINSNAARITINSNGSDVDFAVDSDATANVFYVDAGTGTASFGTSTQTTNAIVAFNASNSILMPVGNTGQRPATGVTGMLRFNTTTNGVEVYDATQWSTVGTPSFTVISDEQFTGNGVQTAFTLSSSSQTTNSLIVSINGIVQIPTIAYSLSGNTLTFTEAPQTGDSIDVRGLTTTTTVTAISNSPGNAIVQPNATSAIVEITGDLNPVANVTYNLGTSSLRWKDLFLSGSSLTLGNIVMKNTSGNTVAFYGPDGTTPATIDSTNVDTTTITNGTSNVSVASSGGNVRFNIGGTSNVMVVQQSTVAITGDLSVSGNATLSGNILGDRVQNGTTSFDIQTASGNANITVGGTSNVVVWSTAGQYITGLISASGNITGGNLITGGTLSVTGNIVSTGSNGVANIGSATTYFNTVHAKATSAQYADLAENYAADAKYAPGTVLSFGGTNEVTVSKSEGDRRIAGVVSTNPSYVMNAVLEADYVATIALTGRVPTLVSGTVAKGDMMISAGNGRAIACATPTIGTVIGKALEDHAGGDGVIEVVVGRL